MTENLNLFWLFDDVFHFSTKSQAGKNLNHCNGNSKSGLITKKNVFNQTSSPAVDFGLFVSLYTWKGSRRKNPTKKLTIL